MLGTLAPALFALGALALFYFGTLFGAWMTESEAKRRRRAAALPLVEVVDEAGR